ncbi:MAG: hypothetical protein KBA60_03580 [Flavobacteriales bacterium]|jgi:hypothetical protein|nr:hypothetical protein [Flavobacteriales bacterium]MBP6642012.1 hypothetical protein [Flavobacteriales bacterium]MBP7155063.1 hypothetical protein [Flavobacteriales bacterium]HQV74503.1 phosphatase PAP2-related protein [Flavobacteriales bacterium]HQW40284.1 phosphatase PAP2-related protein [Flavobacteriales bacterium]
MALERKARKIAWVVTVAVGLFLLFLLPAFFGFIDTLEGFAPYEPLLSMVPAMDVSIPLFIVLYASILTMLVLTIRVPLLALRTLQAALVLALFRMAMMALVPLIPPPGLIALQDPCVQVLYPTSFPFEKDLFFSGHTANLFLFVLAAPTRGSRLFMMVATFLVAIAVLVQHVHWTVDVVAAPFFAVLAWWCSRWTMVLSTR